MGHKTKRPAKTQNPLPPDAFLPKSDGVELIPVVLREFGMAKLLRVPMKCLRSWRCAGKFEGTYVVRGHHVLHRPHLLITKMFGCAA